MPTFVSTYLATQDVRAIALAAFNIALATAIYYPFVRAYERHVEARSMIARICERLGIGGRVREAALAALRTTRGARIPGAARTPSSTCCEAFLAEGIAESDLAGYDRLRLRRCRARTVRIAAGARLRRRARAGAALDRQRNARDRRRARRAARRPRVRCSRSRRHAVRHAAQRDLRRAALARRARRASTPRSRSAPTAESTSAPSIARCANPTAAIVFVQRSRGYAPRRVAARRASASARTVAVTAKRARGARARRQLLRRTGRGTRAAARSAPISSWVR